MQITSILETRRQQTNEVQRDDYIWVMRNLMERMYRIERKWDKEDHNIVEKLGLKAKSCLYQNSSMLKTDGH